MRGPPAIGVRQWNCDHESASLVEWWLGKNKPRTMLCLLVADSWIHTCPNNVPAGRKGGVIDPPQTGQSLPRHPRRRQRLLRPENRATPDQEFLPPELPRTVLYAAAGEVLK